MEDWPKIKPSGDSAVLVEFENRIDPEVNRAVRALALTIESDRFPGVWEVLPAYRTLMVTYDPLQVEYPVLVDRIQGCLGRAGRIDLPPRRVFRLPTVYGGAHGPDLERVSRVLHLSPEEVTREFSRARFLVYFIGFICGLAYLGGLPEKLRVPRLTTPRTWVPGGSVGFAGGQVNAITTDQPSGFNYIGRTFVILYDPRTFPPIPFVAGDEILFPPVSEEEALEARGRRAEDFL
ncbi:MAG: 5-oxoprolinase subunit PxpB [Deltaproteobacteria bacterium]|nr:5-oxoprolinase subunit PxpB [Deltaproteobacteria bacterium]